MVRTVSSIEFSARQLDRCVKERSRYSMNLGSDDMSTVGQDLLSRFRR